MGKLSRLRAEKHAARRVGLLPPCSYQFCEQGRPPGEYLIRKKDGTFFTSCASCLEPMMQAIKLKGIDAQVISRAALKRLEGHHQEQSSAAETDAARASCCPTGPGPPII